MSTAVGDINGDGQLDLVVAAGMGGGPRIAVYDGMSFLSGSPVKLTADFFAFEAGLRNGTYVTVTDLDNDGYGDVVVGAGAGGAPRVVAFSGQSLAASQQRTIVDVYVSNADNRSGVRLAAADVDDDGVPDLITGSGPGGSGEDSRLRGGRLARRPGIALRPDSGRQLDSIRRVRRLIIGRKVVATRVPGLARLGVRRRTGHSETNPVST